MPEISSGVATRRRGTFDDMQAKTPSTSVCSTSPSGLSASSSIFVLVAPVMLTVGRFVPPMRRGYATLIHRFIRVYFRGFPFLRVEVSGRENLPEGGGYILGPAHSIRGDAPPENIVALIETVRSQ